MSNHHITHPITGQTCIPDGVHMAQMTITPDQARDILTIRNINNRNLNQKTVMTYSRDMLAGAWLLNGDAIRFAHDGTLLDGQHRLAAVVKAGIPLRTFVVWNLPSESQATMDDGRKRSMADVLNLSGTSANAQTLAALARRYLLWEQGDKSGRGASGPTKTEMQDFIAAHPEARVSAQVAEHVRYAKTVRCPASTLALAHYLFSKKSPAHADDFFEKLRTGAGLEMGSPILLLRNRLSAEGSMRVRNENQEVIAWFIKAWNAYRTGSQPKVLRIRDGESFPEVI